MPELCRKYFARFPTCRSNAGPVLADNKINWYSYEKGMAEGKKQGKKIFIHFYADWCRYCSIMEQKTFRNSSVISYLNTNYIPIRVNSDIEKKIAMDYRVRGLPFNWFLSKDGEQISYRPGYIAPEELISYLKFISTDSYKKMTLKTFLKNQDN